VITIRDYVKNNEIKLSEEEINRLDVILFALTNSTVSSALGGTLYEQARQDIILLMPLEVKKQIEPLFTAIDGANGNKDAIKKDLQQIIDIVKVNAGEGESQIDPLDLDLIVMPKICQILNYYEIDSKACEDQAQTTTIEEGNEPATPQKEKGSLVGKIFKTIVIIILILGAIFGALV